MKIFLVMIALFYVPPLWAGNPQPASDDVQHELAATLHTLSPVIVHATAIESGQTTIGGAELDMLPSATGSITEALKGMSQIQYDYERQSSLTVGEIAPPRISISGAKPYENNFMIDGMSVTNTLNPAGLDGRLTAVDLYVGGGDATIFYDTSLLESVQVYSSNVPAQYGGFVGGVVDARLRNPATDRWRFTLSGRYTEDSFYDQRDVEDKSDEYDKEPDFTIYHAGLSAEGPVNDYAALLLSYSRQHSSIPRSRITEKGVPFKDNQKRTNENYFARLTLLPHNELNINVDLTYAPYKALRWDYPFLDSGWYIENRSWRFATQVDYFLSSGVLTGKAALAQHGFSRDSQTSVRYSGPDDQYGGLGDANNRTREANASFSFVSTDRYVKNGYFNYAAGLEYGYKHIDMWNEGVELYSLTATRRTIQTYEEISQSSNNSNLGGYGQIELVWHRFFLRPGIRIDYDRFSGNTDIAPRFKSEYDLFGNGVLRLGIGVNRYYGQHLSAYAFRRHRPINTQVFDLQLDGSEIPRPPTVSTSRNFSSDGLSTPYSDEISGEISGSALGFEYAFTAVQRNHKKQLISKTDDGISYALTNDGKSEYQGISGYLARTFSISSLGVHRLSLSATKSKTYSVTGDYNSDIRESLIVRGYDLHYDMVFYEGTFMPREDLPAGNYNTPLIIVLSINSSFYADRVRLMSIVRWQDSSKGLVSDRRINEDTPYGTTSGSSTSTSNFWINPDGGYSQAYKSGKISGGSTTDITAEFDAIKTDRYHLTLILEVLNLFNGNMQTGVVEDAPGIHGRGFYLGARMTF